MADLYLDHNVAIPLAPLLRGAGHTVVTARELALEHAGDDEHVLNAAQQRRILVTHNRADFVLLHAAWQRWSTAWRVSERHAGILILPQPLAVPRMGQAIIDFLQRGQAIENELYEWRPSTGWSRR